MKIEAGKFYRTRDGRKVGPAEPSGSGGRFEFRGPWCYAHEEDGRYFGRKESERVLDIVAEWSDGPVREVVTTRREIVPGVYDRLEVVDSDQDRVHLRLAARGGIALASNSTHVLSRDELDQLITNLTALRDVL